MLKATKAKLNFLWFCQLSFWLFLMEVLFTMNDFAVVHFASGNDLLFYTATNSFELSTPLPTKVHTPCRALCGVASEWPQPWQGVSSLRNWGLEAGVTVTQADVPPLALPGVNIFSICECAAHHSLWCPALLRICLFAGVPLSTWVVPSWWWDKERGEGHSCWTVSPSKYTLTL